MGAFAAILGCVGGLFAVLGIITAIEVIYPIMTQLTWEFWFILAAILMLSAIALKRGGGHD
jgi:hypothetical protein